MPVQAHAWRMVAPGAPLQSSSLQLPEPEPEEVVLQVQGCGVCHTDLGFLYDGIRTRHDLPLTLGHEIAGTVIAAGHHAHLQQGGNLEVGQAVLVPAVLPCGECALCLSERGNICSAQKMPGNDFDGGFATHLVVPARFLIPLSTSDPEELRLLSVVADAVTTPYQALMRGRVSDGEPVILIGAGGIGIYGIQIAAALGAQVLAVDLRQERLQQAARHGATATVCTAGLDARAARQAVRQAATELGWGRDGWKVFEMSGSSAGQQLAFSLLTRAGLLGIVGFTGDKVELRLSNLMAFDAEAFGSWGCRPEHYPDVLSLIENGQIQIRPFVSFHPLDTVNDVLTQVHEGVLGTRAILVPEESGS